MNYNEASSTKLNVWIPKELQEDLGEWATIFHEGNLSDAAREALYFFFEGEKALQYRKEKVTAHLRGVELQISYQEEQKRMKEEREKRHEELTLQAEEQKQQKIAEKEIEAELSGYINDIYRRLTSPEIAKGDIPSLLNVEIKNAPLNDSQKQQVRERVVHHLCRLGGHIKGDFGPEENPNVS